MLHEALQENVWDEGILKKGSFVLFWLMCHGQNLPKLDFRFRTEKVNVSQTSVIDKVKVLRKFIKVFVFKSH